MALTTTDLAAALRLGDGATAPVEPLAGILARLLAYAAATIDHYKGPDTPDAVRDQAVIQLAAYQYDRPDSPRGASWAAAFRNSGAESVIEPWTVRRAGPLEIPE